MNVNQIVVAASQIPTCRTNSDRLSKVQNIIGETQRFVNHARKILVQTVAAFRQRSTTSNFPMNLPLDIEKAKQICLERHDEIAKRLKQGLEDSLRHIERHKRYTEGLLAVAKYPERDCENVPLKADGEKLRHLERAVNETRAERGERHYQQAKRFAQEATVQAVIDKIMSGEVSIDFVSGCIETVEARLGKKFPENWLKMLAYLESVDFWHEAQLRNELAGLKEIHATILDNMAQAAKPLITDQELYKLVDEGMNITSEKRLLVDQWD